MASGYAPIEDYGAIGNLRSVALISRQGSIDWCCLPALDSPSVFGALLDHRRGGRFRVSPAGAGRGDQRYLADSNVLETSWKTTDGRLTVVDFMPLRGPLTGSGEPVSAPAVHRLLRCQGGACEVEVEWSPRFDYARVPVEMEAGEHGVFARAGGELMRLEGLPAEARIVEDGGGPVLRAALTLEPGEGVPLLSVYGDGASAWPLPEWETALRETARAWSEWLEARDGGEPCDFAGVWQPLLDRSALTLKLLTYPRTGAIAAAATTSLPEEIGGERNWDYRYTWIRDASFTAQAFLGFGHRSEAVAFLQWAEDAAMEDAERQGKLHLMYSLHGEVSPEERTLDHLEGYRGSRPVRIGNEAAEQFQLDIFGELLDAAWELARLGVVPDPPHWRFLTRVVEQACGRWQEKDYGIWEVRSEPKHFVHSKLMVWVALDRALRLAEKFGLEGDLARWRRTRGLVRESILERGYDPQRGAFVQAYDSGALDAASLLVPLAGLLPFEDARVQSTLDRCLEELSENGLLYRYRTEETDDGLEGGEGAFGLATFWMVDALALSGRLDEAWELFEGLAARANHVGLYAEQIDPSSGAFLGNFPQAFTHIGCVNSAIYLAYAEGRRIPVPSPVGSSPEREVPGVGGVR